MLFSARELTTEQKRAVEFLLGRPLRENEHLSIYPLPDEGEASFERRRKGVAGLRSFFAELDATREPVGGAEADEVVTEALRSIKPGYQSIR